MKESQKDKKPSQIHDRLFKAFRFLWTRPESFRGVIPEESLRDVDLEKLELDDTNFIRNDLSPAHADLMLVAPIKNSDERIGITFLFEHKSYDAPKVMVQILDYMAQIWSKNLKSPHPLDFIVPILVTHGNKNSSISTKFVDYFSDKLRKNYLRFIPNFEVVLIDLASGNFPEELTPLLLLVEAGEFKTEKDAADWFDRTERLGKMRWDNNFLIHAVMYINAINPLLKISVIKNLIKTRKSMLSKADLIEEAFYEGVARQNKEIGMEVGKKEGKKEGIKEGIKEGKKEGIALLVQNMLKNLSSKEVAKYTSLSEKEVMELANWKISAKEEDSP